MPAYAPDSVTLPPSASHGFLIDMDGVIYRGSEIIPGADRFIRDLPDRRLPFLFLTNNSRRTRRDVVAKLRRLGIHVRESHMLICAMATARFLAAQKPAGTACVIGAGGLLQALHHNGYAVVDHDPDSVVVGEGRAATYEMMDYRTILVLSGGTRREDLDRFAYRPDLVVDSVADLAAAELAHVPARNVA
jgi:NagD protein